MKMNELVYLKHDGVICNSLQVAEKFGKRHSDVMRAIFNQRKNTLVEKRKLYKQIHYIDAKGESRPMYLMNRQDRIRTRLKMLQSKIE